MKATLLSSTWNVSRTISSNEGMDYPASIRGSTCILALYTTHTPVPAGHDHFPEPMVQNYLHSYAHQLGISWNEFVALGRVDPDNGGEDFNMSHLAIRLSQEVNGVSKLHGEVVSAACLPNCIPGYSAEELHISYVTNSVHYPTWIAAELNELYKETFR